MTFGYQVDAVDARGRECFDGAGDRLTKGFAKDIMGDRNFHQALTALPDGYSEGTLEGVRYGVALHRSADGKRLSLFARELAGNDVVSFNLYRTGSGKDLLKPCEMPREKVVAFVLGFTLGA